MGKRLIITESEKKQILSLYEENTNTSIPPPSESVLIANKNPFRYSEFESARREYSPDLKDGELFYISKKYQYGVELEKKFNQQFIKDLYNKTAKYDDVIYVFLSPYIHESSSISFPYKIGDIRIEINGDYTQNYFVKRTNSRDGSFIIDFDKDNNSGLYTKVWIPSIQELYNKKYKEELSPKLKIENIPDEYFEIRKIQRQQTDF